MFSSYDVVSVSFTIFVKFSSLIFRLPNLSNIFSFEQFFQISQIVSSMLRQKALVEVLGQVNTAEVSGSLLFNREGLLIAYSGYRDSKDHANVSAALISSIWESFDRKGNNDHMRRRSNSSNPSIQYVTSTQGFEELPFGIG
ncbi:hypothetical protein KIN20_035866 [Parelaphostrongylus tenuis]|uniref:Roadblock/LAMTOR2 domain-containing protein n=1 Tax=Parelaphostrongylus tenuis TaxID=148309 RepID=A0AAD5RBU6_PARTN|nr:hypothetical protein KIN20_035866 [Parelaphostrongylus tenuis]